MTYQAQNDGPGTPFLIYCTRKRQLVLASLSDQLKWGFTILKTNTKKRMDGSLTDDDRTLMPLVQALARVSIETDAVKMDG